MWFYWWGFLCFVHTQDLVHKPLLLKVSIWYRSSWKYLKVHRKNRPQGHVWKRKKKQPQCHHLPYSAFPLLWTGGSCLKIICLYLQLGLKGRPHPFLQQPLPCCGDICWLNSFRLRAEKKICFYTEWGRGGSRERKGRHSNCSTDPVETKWTL